MILRCPICMGDIVDMKVEVYEDEEKVRTVVMGRCGRCGAPFKREVVHRKKAFPAPTIKWATRVPLGAAP